MAEVATRLHALRNLEPGTVILPPSQAAAKISMTPCRRCQRPRCAPMKPGCSRNGRPPPAPPSSQAPVPAKTERSSWLIVALLCAVILGGVTSGAAFAPTAAKKETAWTDCGPVAHGVHPASKR